MSRMTRLEWIERNRFIHPVTVAQKRKEIARKLVTAFKARLVPPGMTVPPKFEWEANGEKIFANTKSEVRSFLKKRGPLPVGLIITKTGRRPKDEFLRQRLAIVYAQNQPTVPAEAPGSPDHDGCIDKGCQPVDGDCPEHGIAPCLESGL